MTRSLCVRAAVCNTQNIWCACVTHKSLRMFTLKTPAPSTMRSRAALRNMRSPLPTYCDCYYYYYVSPGPGARITVVVIIIAHQAERAGEQTHANHKVNNVRASAVYENVLHT